MTTQSALPQRPSFGVAALLATTLLAGVTVPATADTQRLQLQAGWNLVALSVEPVDPAPGAVFASLGANLQSVWSYDNITGVWGRFPQPAVGAPTVDALRSGRGYWVQVAATANVDIDGVDGALPEGPGEISAGWNLVGFPLLESAAYDRVLANPFVREVWAFNGSQFEGVVIDAAGLVVREDFLEMEPGRGYWVRSVQPSALSPVLRTSLPADVDLPPLVDEDPPVDGELPWNISQGDLDIGRDQFYDRALTQRGVDFRARILQHQMTIANGGSGVLRYRVSIDEANPNCEWLRLQIRDRVTGETELVSEVSGAITTERTFVTLAAFRADRAPGEYDCGFTVESNGVLPPPAASTASLRAVEPLRSYEAFMTVGGLEGDYRLRVELDTVDGKPADLANPRIALSLYEDTAGLKAVVDAQRTLLFPADVAMAGRIIEFDTTRFEVNGSLLLAEGADGNPFAAAVRRDITLRGRRSDRSGLGGPALLSPDLEGEYFETVRGVTDQPIQLVGTFTGERLGTIATARGQALEIDPSSVGVPDDDEILATIDVTDRLLIDEIDVTTNLTHPRPSDLVLSLLSPSGTEILLRDRSAADLGNQVFDEIFEPLESLEAFDGEMATGTWSLRVQDVVAGETGNLLNWSLDVRGTPVYDVGGSVCSSVPEGAQVFLVGCGRTEIGAAAADGSFLFPDLVQCVYQVQLRETLQVTPEPPGGPEVDLWFEARQAVVPDQVTGDVILPEFCPAPQRIPAPPGPVELPQDGQFRFTSLTTSGAAGIVPRDAPPDPGNPPPGWAPILLEQQYGLDTATWDLDRAPLDPSSPGPEDSNAFLDVPDPLTMTNQVGDNVVLDGPVGANSYRILVNIAQPVIGRSVQGELVLNIGGNP